MAVNLGEVRTLREDRAAASRFRAAHPYDRGSAELNDAARAMLDPLYGAVIVLDDPYAPDGAYADAWQDAPDYATCPAIVGKRDPRPCRFAQDHGGKHAPRPAAPAVAPAVAPQTGPAPAAPLSIVPAAPESAARPTCPRCGQTFRAGGSGFAWHVANRPDCAADVRQRLAIA